MKKRTAPLGPCVIDDCPRQAKYANKGWCQTHYHRWYRTGDPLGVKMKRGASGPETRSWKGDDITYRGAHTRVQAQRGSASSYPCESCGGQAGDWAYDHSGETKYETINGQTVPYSSDPQRYKPLCHGCHVKLDRGEHGSGWARKTHCKYGHPFDDKNTRLSSVTRRGVQRIERGCRTCSRDQMRERRAAP